MVLAIGGITITVFFLSEMKTSIIVFDSISIVVMGRMALVMGFVFGRMVRCRGMVNWRMVNWGMMNWSVMNWSMVNWGMMNWGMMNWGMVNWGMVYWGVVNRGMVNRYRMMQRFRMVYWR